MSVVTVTAAFGGSAAVSSPDSSPELGLVPNEVIVGFHGGIPSDVAEWLAAFGGSVLIREDVLGWVSVRLPDAAAADALLADSVARDDVRFAERDGYAAALLTPNDPYYRSQWGYPVIAAPAAWDTQLGTHAVKVAILDTGIQTNHPDLAANACGPNTSFVPGEPTIADGHGHGTHVSGTVAAVSNNGVGVAGTSQSCLVGVKVLNSWGSGQWSWIAAGIRWAADNGAHVISMSLGGGSADSAVHDALKYAYHQKGVLVIAAAGNSGCSNPNGAGSVLYPARFPEAMAVAALSSATTTAGFSSCGSAVEIAAPGQSILSTMRNSGYASWSGTSMAAPHVSGVAALYKSHYPAATNQVIRCVLAVSADDISGPGRDGHTGFGRLNATKPLLAGIGPVSAAVGGVVAGVQVPVGVPEGVTCPPDGSLPTGSGGGHG